MFRARLHASPDPCASLSIRETSHNLGRFARLTPKPKPSLSLIKHPPNHGAASEIYKATTKMKPKSRWLCRNNALPWRLPITPLPAAYFCPSYFCPPHPAWRVASGHGMDGSRIPSGAVLHSLTRPTHTAISNPQPSAALHSPTRCATNSPSFRGPKVRLALLPPHSDLHAQIRPARFRLKRRKPYPIAAQNNHRESTARQGFSLAWVLHAGTCPVPLSDILTLHCLTRPPSM
jgi:hypothetical protein